MAIFLLTGVALFTSFLANLLLLRPLARLLANRLWKLAPPPALQDAAGIDHFLAATVTAAVFGLQWRDHSTSAVVSALFIYLLLLGGGVARLLLLTKRQMQQLEAPQFDLQNRQLHLLQTETPDGPLYCRLYEISRNVKDKYPQGFSQIRVELYTPVTGLVAYNSYYDHLQAAGVRAQLQQNSLAADFDRLVVGRSPRGDLLGVRLGSDWIPVLCGPLNQLPPQVRTWWRKFLAENPEEPREIEDTSFSRFLRQLYLAAEQTQLLQPSFTAELAGLEHLTKEARGPLHHIAAAHLARVIPANHIPRLSDKTSALIRWQPG